MTISKKERNLLIVMVLVVVMAAWLALTGGSKSGTKKLLPLSEAQSQLVKATQQLKQMNADQDVMEPRVEQYSYDEAPSLLAPQVVRELQDIEAKAGIHFEDVKIPPKPVQVKGVNVLKIPLEVHFHAAFQPNVVKFLYYVETSTSKMTVEKLNVTSTDARLKTVDVTAQISVFTRALPGGNTSQTGDVSYVYTTARNG